MSYDYADVEQGAGRRSKTSRSTIGSVDWDPESMSYAGFDPTMSMSLTLSATDAPPATAASSEPIFDDIMGRIVFQYMSQCADVELNMDSCLVAKTIDSFMSTVDANFHPNRKLHFDPSHRQLRFLQAPDSPDAACGPREEPAEREVRPLVEAARRRCAAEGVDASAADVARAGAAFHRVVARGDCWASLCGAEAFRLHFGRATRCAGVDPALPDCALEHLFRLVPAVTGAGDGAVAPCVQPSHAEWRFFVSFIVTDATAECGAAGVAIEAREQERATADLMATFSASRCWDVGECDDGPAASSADVVPEDRYEVTADGRRCAIEALASETSVELSFFYGLETRGPLIEASVEGIEKALIHIACDDGGGGGKERALNGLQLDAINVVAIDSVPKDSVSNCKCVFL